MVLHIELKKCFDTQDFLWALKIFVGSEKHMFDSSQLTQGGVIAGLLAMIGGVCLAFVKMLQNNGCVFASKCCTFDCNKGRAEKPPDPPETTTET